MWVGGWLLFGEGGKGVERSILLVGALCVVVNDLGQSYPTILFVYIGDLSFPNSIVSCRSTVKRVFGAGCAALRSGRRRQRLGS